MLLVFLTSFLHCWWLHRSLENSLIGLAFHILNDVIQQPPWAVLQWGCHLCSAFLRSQLPWTLIVEVEFVFEFEFEVFVRTFLHLNNVLVSTPTNFSVIELNGLLLYALEPALRSWTSVSTTLCREQRYTCTQYMYMYLYVLYAAQRAFYYIFYCFVCRGRVNTHLTSLDRK